MGLTNISNETCFAQDVVEIRIRYLDRVIIILKHKNLNRVNLKMM